MATLVKCKDLWVVLVACHNRVETTTRSLTSAKIAFEMAKIRYHFVVFDDGSSDGTSDAVTALFGQDVSVIRGDGSNFWAKSMHLAEKFVFQNFDSVKNIVWLNDDSFLDSNAFSIFSNLQRLHPNSLIVGSMRDSLGSLTYGGLDARGSSRPLAYKLVQPDPIKALPIRTLNGNLVIIPAEIAKRLGGIQGGYTHAFADIDYGIRASKSGIEVILAPGFLGICERNPEPSTRGFGKAWKDFKSVKGGGNFTNLRLVISLTKPHSWRFWIFVIRVTWILRFLINSITRAVSK